MSAAYVQLPRMSVTADLTQGIRAAQNALQLRLVCSRLKEKEEVSTRGRRPKAWICYGVTVLVTVDQNGPEQDQRGVLHRKA